MERRASGIIVRLRPLTETSVIVQWITAEMGRIATVAKGARRPKSPYAGKLDLFFSADFSYKTALRGELHTLLEVGVSETHPRLRLDYPALRMAAYGVAFIEQMTETETPLPEIYDLFNGFIDHLSTGQTQPRLVYAFELRLLALLGTDFDPGENRHELSELVRDLQELPWAELPDLMPTAESVRRLRQALQVYIVRQCDKLPAGRAEALSGD